MQMKKLAWHLVVRLMLGVPDRGRYAWGKRWSQKILLFSASFVVICSPVVSLAYDESCGPVVVRLEQKIDKLSDLFTNYLEASLKTAKYLSLLQIYNDNVRVWKSRLATTQNDLALREITLKSMEAADSGGSKIRASSDPTPLNKEDDELEESKDRPKMIEDLKLEIKRLREQSDNIEISISKEQGNFDKAFEDLMGITAFSKTMGK